MSGNKNKLIAFNYFGGKFTWVDQLITYFPAHVHFVDVFCGSLAVTLNKPYSRIDTANDINSEVINFFKVLRNKPEELIMLLSLTPVSREEYNNAWVIGGGLDEIEAARRFYVRVRQSFYGLGIQRKNKGWQMSSKNSGCKHGETVNKWHNALEKLWDIVERLTHVQLENAHYRDLMPKLNHETTFFYLDPPYPEESRKSKNDYRFDFTIQDHEELAALANSTKSKVMISGYNCDLMQHLYKGWEMVEFKTKKNNIRSGMVQECIWMNYEAPFRQLSLI